MSCACYEASIKSCSETMKVKAGLAANTTYFWIIENKFEKIYQRQADTDGDGVLEIDLTVLPEGATNPHAGHYNLSLRAGDDYLSKVGMTFGEEAFECVSFNFIEVDDDPENPYNVIQ